MARHLFGAQNETAGAAYLLDWISKAPIYGRETSDNMLDNWASPQPFSEDGLVSLKEGTERRKALLAGIKPPSNIPDAKRHLAY
jgi:hypothetical protein